MLNQSGATINLCFLTVFLGIGIILPSDLNRRPGFEKSLVLRFRMSLSALCFLSRLGPAGRSCIVEVIWPSIKTPLPSSVAVRIGAMPLMPVTLIP